MNSISHSTPALVSAFLSWRVLMVIAVFGVGLAQLIPWLEPRAAQASSPTLNCEALDRQASVAVSALVLDSSGRGELRLDEALMQLRRARKNCRAGFNAVAVNDYVGLSRSSFDGATASIENARR
jgi:hypothetical protein